VKANIVVDLMTDSFSVRIAEVLPDALAKELLTQEGCAQLVLQSGQNALHVVMPPAGFQAIADVLAYYLNERTIKETQNAPSTEEPQ
jgi:hypothetical protein